MWFWDTLTFGLLSLTWFQHIAWLSQYPYLNCFVHKWWKFNSSKFQFWIYFWRAEMTRFHKIYHKKLCYFTCWVRLWPNIGHLALFTSKIKFLLVRHVTYVVLIFTGENMGIKTQLNMNKWASVNMLDVKFQVHLGAEKVQWGNCHEIEVYSK